MASPRPLERKTHAPRKREKAVGMQRVVSDETRAPASTTADVTSDLEILRRDPDSARFVQDTLDAQRRQAIEAAAYYRAEKRGFASGYELEDWLAAEADYDRSTSH
jgi:hypothetical protein